MEVEVAAAASVHGTRWYNNTGAVWCSFYLRDDVIMSGQTSHVKTHSRPGGGGGGRVMYASDGDGRRARAGDVFRRRLTKTRVRP